MGSCFSQEVTHPYQSVRLGNIKKGQVSRASIRENKEIYEDDPLRRHHLQTKPKSPPLLSKGQRSKIEEGIKSSNEPKKEEDLVNLFENDALVTILQKQLQALSPTHEQLLQIAGYLQSINFSSLSKNIEEQDELVSNLLQQNSNTNMDELLKKLEPKVCSSNANRIQSRLFYGLGNIVKKQNIFWGVFKDSRKPKELAPEEISELTNYEAIQQQIEKFTESFYLKFREIAKNTEQMARLFTQCLCQNKGILTDKEFFALSNGFKAAKFAKQGCCSDKRGIYIFLNYLVRTIKKMEEEKIPLDLIEELVKLLIQNLSKMYPPGQDLVGGDESLRKTLKDIEIICDKDKPLQNNPLIRFKGQANKRKVLEDTILDRAKIAQKELPYLNEIIRENCLYKCIGVDSNLKLYAQAKNEKALIRITEKILFKDQKKIEENLPKGLDAKEKDALEKKYQQDIRKMMLFQKKYSNSEKLEDCLKEQQRKYRNEVEARLKDKEELQFTISDMVRGKCTFSNIEDILETITKIINYVDSSQTKNPKKFRILEIESRFTKPIPISDITLKIALHECIIAQLQLTLQKNVATYAFAHKIYELQRSKAFSKIKKVFNYYEEYKKEFSELVIGQIQLSSGQTNQQSQAIQSVTQDVAAYFEISGDNTKPSLINVLSENNYESRVLNEQEKILVEAVFDRKMMKTNRERTPLFSKYLRKANSFSQPDTFTSVLFYQMIKDIDISENVNEICGPYECLEQYLNKQLLRSDQFNRLQAVYLPTFRTQMKYRQLEELFKMVKKQSDKQYDEKILSRVYGNNQEMCEWLVRKGKVYDHNHQYSKANQEYEKALEIINEKGEQSLSTKIRLSKAITFLKTKDFKAAADILSDIKSVCKVAKQYKNATICTVLLSECALNEGGDVKFRGLYDEAIQIVALHKINFGGVQIADSQYRIGQRLLQQNPKEALDVHLRHAFEQYGEFMYAKQLVEKMKESWNKYKEMGIQQPKLKVNQIIKEIDLRKEQSKYLGNNKLGEDGCSHLSRAQWPNLQTIMLQSNNIGSEGCEHLSKAQWSNLQKIMLCKQYSKDLESNNIGDDGCKHLSKAIWPNLQTIILCRYVNKYLEQNNIGDDGCLYLSKAQWPNLQTIVLCKQDHKYLELNNIGDDGCLYLSKAQWPNLEMILLCKEYSKYLEANIGDDLIQKVQQLLRDAFPNARILM